MRHAILAVLLLVLGLQPAQAAVTYTYTGIGTTYYTDPDFTPPGLPEFIPINFSAVLTYGRYGIIDGSFTATRVGSGELVTSNDFFYTDPSELNRISFLIDQNFFTLFPERGNPGYAGYGSITTVNGKAVPEPSTWAMMVVGFMMLGWTIRRTSPSLAHA